MTPARLFGFWLGYFLPFIVAAFAFVTHLQSCIDHGRIYLLIASIGFPPIGVLHGWGLWLGIFAT